MSVAGDGWSGDRDLLYLSHLLKDRAGHPVAADCDRRTVRHIVRNMDAQPGIPPSRLERGLAAWLIRRTPTLKALFTGERKSRKGFAASRKWFEIEAEKVMRPFLARIALAEFDRRHGGGPRP